MPGRPTPEPLLGGPQSGIPQNLTLMHMIKQKQDRSIGLIRTYVLLNSPHHISLLTSWLNLAVGYCMSSACKTAAKNYATITT